MVLVFRWIEIEVLVDNDLERVLSLEQSPNFMSQFSATIPLCPLETRFPRPKFTHPSETNHAHKDITNKCYACMSSFKIHFHLLK